MSEYAACGFVGIIMGLKELNEGIRERGSRYDGSLDRCHVCNDFLYRNNFMYRHFPQWMATHVGR